MKKVANYEVKILWTPRGSVHGKKIRRIGAIAGRMVEVLTQEMDENVRSKKGNVEAGLFVATGVVAEYRTKGQIMGLGEFVWGLDGGSLQTQVRELGVAEKADQGGKQGGEVEANAYLPKRFKAIPGATSTHDEVWQYRDESVCRHELRKDHDELTTFQADDEGRGASTQMAKSAIVEEITGFVQANWHTKIQP